MFFKSLAGALALSTLTDTSYNAVTTPVQDVCAAIRPTVKVTVTVTIDLAGRIQSDSVTEGNYGSGHKSVAKPVVDAVFVTTTGADVPTWTKKFGYGEDEDPDVPASTVPYWYTKYSKAAEVTSIFKNGYGDYTKAAASSSVGGKGYYVDDHQNEDLADGDYDADDDGECEDENEEEEDVGYAASYTHKSYSRASSYISTKTWSRHRASSSAIEPSGVYGAETSSTLSSSLASGTSSRIPSASSAPVSSKTSSASLSADSSKSFSVPSSRETSYAISSPSTSKVSSEASSSSSVVSSATSSPSSTITSLSTSSSSSTSSSVSSSSSAPPLPCIPGGNRLINQGFVDGVLEPWTTTPVLVGPNNVLIASTGIAQDSDGRIFAAMFNGPRVTNDGVILSQSNIDLPDGTVVSCRAYAYDSRSDGGASTYTVDIDGTVCGVNTPSGPGWQQVGGDILLTGETHTISITLQTNGVTDTNGQGLYIDNVEVTPIILPEGRSFCPT